MISTQKIIDLTKKSDFTIPVKWKRKLYIEEGLIVSLRVNNNNVVIKLASNNTLDVISTIGRKGRIYVPKEIRNYLERKKTNKLHIYIEESELSIILVPS